MNYRSDLLYIITKVNYISMYNKYFIIFSIEKFMYAKIKQII